MKTALKPSCFIVLVFIINTCFYLGTAYSAIYKCQDARGKTYFQDSQCPTTQTESVLQADPEPVVEPPNKLKHPRPMGSKNPLPEPAVAVPEGERYAISKDSVDSKEWKEIIAQVEKIPAVTSGNGQLSVVRVFIENATHQDQLQAQSSKLKTPKEKFGGGAFRKFKSGDFLVMEHINSHHRQNNQDPLALGSTEHGRSEILIPVPAKGKVQAFGDIVLTRVPAGKRGKLRLHVNSNGVDKQVSSVRLGPITVGGPYGKKFICNDPSICEIENLAPGPYWLLFDRFDPARSRWEFSLKAGDTLELHFKIKDKNLIERVSAGS